VTGPIIWHQDASKTWVAIKNDSEHVEGFTLVPVIACPHFNE
jgi:hypothetical protein